MLSADGILPVVESCTSLETLDIPHCSIEEGRADAVAQKIAETCVKLTDLSLVAAPISDRGVRHLARNCRNLTEINLSECRMITGRIGEDLAYCTKLSSLDLGRCIGIRSNGIVSIVDRPTLLEYFNISNCSIEEEHADAIAQKVAENCPYMTNLNMFGNPITDIGLGHLARGCRNLRKLGLQGCTRITDPAIEAAIAQLKHLVVLWPPHAGSARIRGNG